MSLKQPNQAEKTKTGEKPSSSEQSRRDSVSKNSILGKRSAAQSVAVASLHDSPDKNQSGRVLRARDKQHESTDAKKDKRKNEVQFKDPDEPQAKPTVTLRSGNRSTKQSQIM